MAASLEHVLSQIQSWTSPRLSTGLGVILSTQGLSEERQLFRLLR
jgi:hypothetical protein